MHSELLPGNDRLHCDLNGYKGMTGTLVDAVTKGIQSDKVVFTVSTNGSTFKCIPKRLKNIFWQTRDLMLLSKVILEHPCLMKLTMTFRTGQ